MSDSDRMLALLEEYEHVGVHTHALRRHGISGNPSQRAKDLATRGHEIRSRREWVRGRNGARYWLERFAPADAARVEPNHADDSGLGADARSGRRAARSRGAEPGAVIWLRDYTTVEGLARGWRELRVPRREAA